jgi:Ca2+-binding EF-hand superfamily protein
MSAAEKIAKIDTNGDGKLTAAEHASGSKAMFAKMDADHDGKLTAQEMSAGHERLMSKQE